MRNSRGGLGDIPSRDRAGVKPASARSRRATSPGEVFGPKSRPFRQKVIAVCRALPWSDLTPNVPVHDIAAVALCPYGLGQPTMFRAGWSPRSGWKWWTSGNRGFSHFHEPPGSHFQPICWKWKKSRTVAISRCPMPFPRKCRAGTDRVDIAGGSSGLRPGSDERRIFRLPKDLPSRVCSRLPRWTDYGLECGYRHTAVLRALPL